MCVKGVYIGVNSIYTSQTSFKNTTFVYDRPWWQYWHRPVRRKR